MGLISEIFPDDLISSSQALFSVLLSWVLFISALTSCAQGDDRYCSPNSYKCGDATYDISYPFSTPNQPKSCGYPYGFDVECNNTDNSLQIKMPSHMYHVKYINYENQIATLVDKGFLNDVCCHPPLQNSSLNLKLFDYTGEQLYLILFHDCSYSYEEKNGFLLPLYCLSSRTQKSYFGIQESGDFVFEGSIPDALRGHCKVKNVSIMKTQADKLQGDGSNARLGEALAVGVNVTWSPIDPNNYCWDCVQSNGYCLANTASNFTNDIYPICNCNGKLYPHNCPQASRRMVW